MTSITLDVSALPLIASLPQRVLDLLNLKGQIATLLTCRDAKMRKGRPAIQKESRFQCRIGVNYDNIETVQIKREVGILPEENAGLPWGEWLVFPYVIGHKGNHYFRCTVLNNGYIPRTRWLRDGVEITKEEAQVDCLASEFSEKDNDVFTVKVESILEVNGKAV